MLALCLTACGDIVDQSRLPAAPTPMDVIWAYAGGARGLGEIWNLKVSSAGMVTVGQESDGHILLLNSAGERIDSIGRRGEGPGEFRGRPVFNWIGDSLHVGDVRLSVFTTSGQLARTRAWERSIHLTSNATTSAPFMGGNILLGVRSNDDRILLVLVNSAAGPLPIQTPSPGAAPLRAALRVAPDGAVQTIFDIWSELAPAGCRGEFCRRALAAVSPDAAVVGVARYLREDADSVWYRVGSIGADGDTLFMTTLSLAQRTIPPEVRDSIARERGTEVGRRDIASLEGASRSGGRASASSDPVQEIETYPPYRSLVVGRDSTVWLQRFVDRSWIVIAQDGSVQREVRLAPGIRLRSVAGDTL